jgi:hypothetical protein
MASLGQRFNRPTFTGFGNWPRSAMQRTCLGEQPKKWAISSASTKAAVPNGVGRLFISHFPRVQGGSPVTAKEFVSSSVSTYGRWLPREAHWYSEKNLWFSFVERNAAFMRENTRKKVSAGDVPKTKTHKPAPRRKACRPNHPHLLPHNDVIHASKPNRLKSSVDGTGLVRGGIVPATAVIP